MKTGTLPILIISLKLMKYCHVTPQVMNVSDISKATITAVDLRTI